MGELVGCRKPQATRGVLVGGVITEGLFERVGSVLLDSADPLNGHDKRVVRHSFLLSFGSVLLLAGDRGLDDFDLLIGEVVEVVDDLVDEPIGFLDLRVEFGGAFLRVDVAL